jgi:hypothetical protein
MEGLIVIGVIIAVTVLFVLIHLIVVWLKTTHTGEVAIILTKAIGEKIIKMPERAEQALHIKTVLEPTMIISERELATMAFQKATNSLERAQNAMAQRLKVYKTTAKNNSKRASRELHNASLTLNRMRTRYRKAKQNLNQTNQTNHQTNNQTNQRVRRFFGEEDTTNTTNTTNTKNTGLTMFL